MTLQNNHVNMEIERKVFYNDIAYLYCCNKKVLVETGCNQECQQKKCLCMDEIQLRLLGYVSGMEQDLLTTENGTIEKFVHFPVPDIVCTEQQSGSNKILINCQGTDFEPTRYLNNAEKWAVLNLPVIQMINASTRIDERDTLPFLCLYSADSGKLLIRYFGEILIKLLINFQNKDAAESILKKAGEVFSNIKKYYKEEYFNKNTRRILQNIAQYGNILGTIGFHMIRNEIEKYDMLLAEKEANRGKGPNREKISLYEYIFYNNRKYKEESETDGYDVDRGKIMYCLYVFAQKLTDLLNVDMPEDVEGFWNGSGMVDEENELIEKMTKENADFGYMIDNIEKLSREQSDSLSIENMVNAIKRMAYISE